MNLEFPTILNTILQVIKIDSKSVHYLEANITKLSHENMNLEFPTILNTVLQLLQINSTSVEYLEKNITKLSN